MTDKVAVQGVGVAIGRFNPPTREHEKLFRQIKNRNYSYNFIILLGENEIPLSRFSRTVLLNELEPTFQIKIAANAYEAVESLLKWYRAPHFSIHIHCGEGSNGVKKNYGASTHEMTRILDKFENPNVNVVPNPRGKISGTLVREFLHVADPGNFTYTSAAKQLLHSKFRLTTIEELIEQFQ